MYQATKRKKTIRFKFTPNNPVREVLLAGDFNQWKPAPLKRSPDGSLALDVPAPAGIYQYKFVVDGEWIADPDNTQRAVSPLGTVNSVARIQ
jgi:1,4-alpha-glucan branching enzyme